MLQLQFILLIHFISATSYIKYFGYVQFAGIIAAPLCGLLFRESNTSTTEPLPAKEDFVNKVRVLILPGFVFIGTLILMDALQMLANIHLSVRLEDQNRMFLQQLREWNPVIQFRSHIDKDQQNKSMCFRQDSKLSM